MRAFLDANILFSAAWNADSRLRDLWKVSAVELISSEYAIAEAYRNLADDVQRTRLLGLLSETEIVPEGDAELPSGLNIPQKDIPIIQAAIVGGAEYLITGDIRHFGPYFGKKIGPVTILRPSEFLAKLRIPNASSAWNQSSRLAAVQTPIIPIIAALIRAHPGTISLGQGVVSYGPPPEAAARITDFLKDPENHKYKSVQGIPALVEAIREKLQRENGIDAPARRLFVTAGGNLAFANALLAIADPGDEIILQAPYYFNHEMAITMASCRPVLVPTDGQYQLQPELIRNAITARTKAIVTISPNNPSGAVYLEQALREVNEICRHRGLYHIQDEAYEYFTHGGAKHFSPGSIPDSDRFTISLFSLSKAYGFASWRVGYMVVPEHLVEAVNKIQDTLLICAPVISQYAALGALAAGRAYCESHFGRLTEVRNIVLSQLRQLQDICAVPQSDGAFYFLLRLKTDSPPMAVAEKLIREHRVAVIPGSAFGLERGCHLRLSYGALTPATASEGMSRLVEGVRRLLV